jgi:two-component system, response regulator YesN
MKVFRGYRDTIFTRLILSYTVLSVILIGLAGGYLYSQANRLMLDEISRDNRNRLVAARSYLEGTLLRKYEDSLNSKAMSTIYLQDNSDLNFFLANSWANHLSRISLFREDLQFLKASNEGALALTVYFQSGNYVVDSNSFYAQTGNSPDAEFLAGVENLPANYWLKRTLPDDKEALTYIVKLPYLTSSVPAKGYFFADIELEYITKAAAQMMSTSQDKLYIFDQSGRVLLNTAGSTEAEIELVSKTVQSGEAVNKIKDGNGGKSVLSYLSMPDSENGWTYAMIRPMNSFVLSSKTFQSRIFVSCIAVLLFGFMMSYAISKQLYIPMKRLVQHIRGLYSPDTAHGRMNEYAFIGSTLNKMEQKIVMLESQAKTSELKNLVLGAPLGLEQLEILPPGYRYCAAHIRLREGTSEQLCLLYEEMKRRTPGILVSLSPEEAAVIYYSGPGEETDDVAIVCELRQLQAEAGEELSFGGAVGAWVEAVEKIPLSYQSALHAYRYRFFLGAESVIPHSSLASYHPAPYMFSFDQYKNMLKAGDIQGAGQFIDEFAGILQEKKLQLEAVELALLQLASAIYQAVIEMGLQQLLPPSNLFDELKKETLHTTVEAIRSLSVQIAVHVNESSDHAHVDVIMKLKAYIDEHLDEDLSLNVLSEVSSLAPAYVSTLFGEVIKESFTEYVTRARLNKAAAMLTEDTQQPVREIAAMVGYRNVQYFHTKFKARFGVTPVQYRHAMKGCVNTATNP